MGAVICLIIILALLIFGFKTGFAFSNSGIFLLCLILALGIIFLLILIIKIFGHLLPYIILIFAVAAFLYYAFKNL